MPLAAGIRRNRDRIGDAHPEKIDTNSPFSQELNNLGIVGDRERGVNDSCTRFRSGAECLRCDLPLISGGLGPTEDDLTREAVAMALGRGMVFHDEIPWKHPGAPGSSRPMTDRNRKQAS